MATRVRMTPGWETHVEEATSAWLDDIVDDVATDANRLAPRGRTGRLGRSYGVVRITRLTRHVGSGLEYATTVELGGPPHDIRPKTKKALAWPGGQHPVRVVHHPGSRPIPHLRPALYRKRG
jgi:hypothetical protein